MRVRLRVLHSTQDRSWRQASNSRFGGHIPCSGQCCNLFLALHLHRWWFVRWWDWVGGRWWDCSVLGCRQKGAHSVSIRGRLCCCYSSTIQCQCCKLLFECNPHVRQVRMATGSHWYVRLTTRSHSLTYGFCRMVGFGGSIASRERCLCVCVCVCGLVWSEVRNKMNNLVWSFYSWHMALSFHRDNYRSIDVVRRFIILDDGFGKHDFHVRSRCWIGLGNGEQVQLTYVLKLTYARKWRMWWYESCDMCHMLVACDSIKMVYCV